MRSVAASAEKVIMGFVNCHIQTSFCPESCNNVGYELMNSDGGDASLTLLDRAGQPGTRLSTIDGWGQDLVNPNGWDGTGKLSTAGDRTR